MEWRQSDVSARTGARGVVGMTTRKDHAGHNNLISYFSARGSLVTPLVHREAQRHGVEMRCLPWLPPVPIGTA